MSVQANIKLESLVSEIERVFGAPSSGETKPQGVLIVGGNPDILIRGLGTQKYFTKNPGTKIEIAQGDERYRRGWYCVELDKIKLY
jgi:hypothetical protein